MGVGEDIFVILTFCFYFFSPVWPNAFGGVDGALAHSGLWGAYGLCPQSRELGRFILLGSFSNTLLVVSILDIVYDCHL